MYLLPCDYLWLVRLLPGTVMLNGEREALPVVTGDLVVRRASSSFLLIQTFGAQLLWYLDGPLALVMLQPGFANKVTLTFRDMKLCENTGLSCKKMIASMLT